MASSFNLTIDDSSPLILYNPSGAWQDASSNDTAGLAYTGNTLHSTTAPGATATINFNGTGISIYGGRRPSYGRYTMSVDGTTVMDSTATGDGLEVQQLLGSASGLANGPHTAVLTSTGVGMDIDWVNLETQIGTAESTTTSVLYDDTHPALTYAGSWNTVNNNPSYSNSTLHYTGAAGAAVSLAFSGNAVAVYGTVSPDHANIQITVDGKVTMVDGGSTFVSALHPETLLYYANDLDSSPHMLIVTNPGQQAGTGPFIDLDAVAVFSASSPSASSAATPLPSALDNHSDTRSHPSSRLSTGAMIGIVVGAVFCILVLLALVMLLFLRRKRRAQTRSMDPKTPVDAELPLQGPNMRFTPVSPQQPMPTFSRLATRTSMHSIAPSYYASNNASRSSFASTTPILSMPRAPSRAQQGMMIPNQRGPERPSRPPSLDLLAR
ncbi:hypothetical protein DFH09DRAFT_1359620 [Mycena vulgaris]|nr:hypothetical protein DFH09DRAFT_1359620 [Mycena vulgaris]